METMEDVKVESEVDEGTKETVEGSSLSLKRKANDSEIESEVEPNQKRQDVSAEHDGALGEAAAANQVETVTAEEAASEPLETISTPAKKKSKAKAKSSKVAAKASDRASVATEDTGTPDVEEGGSSETVIAKKGKGKKSMASGAGKVNNKKKKASIQQSGSTTPRETEREEQMQLEEENEATEGGVEEDTEKLYCICKTLYGEIYLGRERQG